MRNDTDTLLLRTTPTDLLLVWWWVVVDLCREKKQVLCGAQWKYHTIAVVWYMVLLVMVDGSNQS